MNRVNVGENKKIPFRKEWCCEAQDYVTGYWNCIYIANTVGGPVFDAVSCDYAEENGCEYLNRKRVCRLFVERLR